MPDKEFKKKSGLTMNYSIFTVENVPYCVWEWNLREKNIEFINSIDPSYFEYLATIHTDQLDGNNAKRAAIALRTGYHHGLETFFTLICAALQAPECVVGWVQKCSTGQVRNIIKQINSGKGHLINKHGLKHLTWELVSNKMNLFSYPDVSRIDETKALFARLWNNLGRDFITDTNIKEYNSIKHGFRAKSGGFSLAFGIEPEYGVSPPPEEMQVLCDSEFGSSYFIAEQVEGAPQSKYDPHFRVKRCAVNWDPIALAHALMLISLSINNVLSFLKILNGVDPRTVPFIRPEDSNSFESPWSLNPGVSNCTFDLIVSERNIKRYSKEEMLKRLEKLCSK